MKKLSETLADLFQKSAELGKPEKTGHFVLDAVLAIQQYNKEVRQTETFKQEFIKGGETLDRLVEHNLEIAQNQKELL